MINDIFLRQIPRALVAGIRSGDLNVYGSTIRHVGNGQIAGFLQETSGMAKVARLVSGGPAAPLQLIGTGIQIVQNEQIKGGIARIEQAVDTLSQLQIANLALGVAGIGVSVAGFVVVSRKIDGVRGDVRALGVKLDRLLDALAQDRAERLDDMIEALRGVAREIDHRWSMSTERAAIGWQRDADEAARLGNFFEGRARRLLEGAPTAVEEATPLLDAWVMASGLHVAALALSGETPAAITVARDDGDRLERLTGTIGAADLARARLSAVAPLPGSATAADELQETIVQTRSLAEALRRREAAATTRGAPFIALQKKGLDARDWLVAARDEDDAPVLLLAN